MFYLNNYIYLNDANSAGAWQNIVPKRFNMRSLLLLVAVIAMPAHSVTIDDYYHDIFACDNCNLQGLVIGAGVEDATINVLAVDRAQANWQSYEIFTDLVGENGQPMIGNKTITPVPTPAAFVAEIQTALSVVYELQALNGQTIPVGDLNLPPITDPVDSAADLIAAPLISGSFENAVSDLISENVFGSLTGMSTRLISKLVTDIFNEVTVTFTDGSRMSFELSRVVFDPTTGKFSVRYKRVEDSGRDSEGNPLPEESSDLNGITISGPVGGNLGEFLDLLDRFRGVTVSGLPSGGAGASCNIDVSCSFDSSGQMNCIASVSGC
ncbi:MAG: hypothetical protein PF630_07660 [Gammaproteobacteria bacterium]|jgi:hypothetical protein|nr:hypothetical protein [Gammaproteobacteria bacterium]